MGKRKSFSQRKVDFVAFLFILCIIGSYILAWFDKDTVENLSITMAGAFTVVVSSYFAQSAYKKGSLNKNGLVDRDGTIERIEDVDSNADFSRFEGSSCSGNDNTWQYTEETKIERKEPP